MDKKKPPPHMYESKDSKELQEAKRNLRYAVVEAFRAGASYDDIGEAVTDAIVIEYNDYVICDIHT